MRDPWSKELHGWLETATRGLCADAKDRIRDEIEAHVSETLSAMEREGVPAGERYDTAVRQLGSPRAARRAYRRQWLTALEAETFKVFERSIDLGPRRFFGLRLFEWAGLLYAPLMFILTYRAFGWTSQTWVFGALSVGVAFTMLAGPAGRVVVRWLGERWAFPTFVAFQFMFLVSTVGMISEFAAQQDAGSGGALLFVVYATVMLCLMAETVYRNVRIWQKLYAGNGPDGHA